MPTRKYNFKKNNYTLKQKQQIVSKLSGVPPAAAAAAPSAASHSHYSSRRRRRRSVIQDEFLQLKQIDIHNISPASNFGNHIVDNYTQVERLNTRKAQQRLNYYDVLYNKKELLKKKYIQKMYRFYTRKNQQQKKPQNKLPEEKIWLRISQMYFGSISIFKPIAAMKIYQSFLPLPKIALLDPTMGWGGRMVAAMAMDLPKYIGIDNNKNLEKPYKNMLNDLQPHSKTRVQLFFQDALTIDYSTMKYDVVFTSPPYYDVEIYGGTAAAAAAKNKQEWNRDFYIPLFTKTFEGLDRNGGIYALNIPDEIYKSVCIPLWGKAHRKIPLHTHSRNIHAYKEYIYVWYKSSQNT